MWPKLFIKISPWTRFGPSRLMYKRSLTERMRWISHWTSLKGLDGLRGMVTAGPELSRAGTPF